MLNKELPISAIRFFETPNFYEHYILVTMMLGKEFCIRRYMRARHQNENTESTHVMNQSYEYLDLGKILCTIDRATDKTKVIGEKFQT